MVITFHGAILVLLMAITAPFNSEALDWCCGDGCTLSYVDEGIIRNKEEVLCKVSLKTKYLFDKDHDIVPMFYRNAE